MWLQDVHSNKADKLVQIDVVFGMVVEADVSGTTRSLTWSTSNGGYVLMLVVVNTCCGGSGGSGCYTLSGSNEYILWWLQRWDLQLGGKQKLISVARQRKNLWSWPPGQATRNCASGGV